MDEKQTTLLNYSDPSQQLRDNLFSNYADGCHCPVCGQYVKLYKRKLTSSMAFGLILINRYFKGHPDEKWVHVQKYFKSIGDVRVSMDTVFLRHWGLLEKKIGEKDDGNPDNGYYGITEKGRQFLLGNIKVPKHLLIYNNEVKGFIDEIEIDIQNSLGSKFNYNELMNTKEPKKEEKND